MKRLIVALLSIGLVLCWGTLALTQEKPEEHPKQEHPKKEHPTGSSKKMTSDIDAAIRASITEQSKSDGMFHVEDTVLNKTWNLSLVKVHKDKLTPLSDDTYFACVDFKADDGTMVDVDFFLKNAEGKLGITDTSVHKIDGAARYMYQEKDGYWVRVDTKQSATKEHPQKEHPKKEHPQTGSEDPPQK